jgi:predicted nucleic acid-binding protein/GNAT superfamily N-acetyltransferase
MPRGAFEEYAALRQLLIAVDSREECVGYVLFRIGKGRAVIAHLCTDLELRRSGIARALVDALKERTRFLLGIGLSCRRDYELDGFWQQFGFAPRAAKQGRGRSGEELTWWWYDHGHPTLFSACTDAEGSRLCVVVDANVFFDLFDADDPDREDSRALLADWLSDTIELCLTPEIYSEINRAEAPERRARSRNNVTRLRMLEPDPQRVEVIIAELTGLFPNLMRESDKSDVKQLANSIAAAASYFVTQDRELQERAEILYDKYGLTVLSPTDLINRLDAIAREDDYQPARLSGSDLRSRLYRSEDESAVIGAFQRSAAGERRGVFAAELCRFVSRPDTYECRLVLEGESPLAMVVAEKTAGECLRVPALRFENSPKGAAVARHLVELLLRRAADEGKHALGIEDAGIGSLGNQILASIGFVQMADRQVKLTAKGAHSTADFRDLALRIEGSLGPCAVPAMRLRACLARYEASPSAHAAALIEKAVWPARLRDAGLPTFVVPIRPGWAMHFFHDEASETMLLGARDEIRFNAEGVYYRANQACGLKAPGRILWYVSKGSDENFPGPQAIVACSCLDEIVVDTPKELYRRFRRLGVYSWRDVFETANRQLDCEMMALRFSHTERFKRPVPNAALSALGVATPFGPRLINSAQFAEVYRSASS